MLNSEPFRPHQINLPDLPTWPTFVTHLTYLPTWPTHPPHLPTHLSYPPTLFTHVTHPPDLPTHPDNLPEPTDNLPESIDNLPFTVHRIDMTSHFYNEAFLSIKPVFKYSLSLNKGIGDAGSTADIRMLWSAMVCYSLPWSAILYFTVLYCTFAQNMRFRGYQKWHFRSPKRKSETTFINQIPPLNLRKITPGTHFRHWKVFFWPFYLFSIFLSRF